MIEHSQRALAALIGSPELRATLGKASRNKAERDYGEAKMFARWAALLEGEETSQSLTRRGN